MRENRLLGAAVVLALVLLAGAPGAARALPGTFEGLYARAEVTGPRGAFVTEIVSLADGRARFAQEHPEWRAAIVVAGDASFDGSEGTGFVAAGSAGVDVVRGHDVHRLALARGGRPARIELPEPAGSGRGPVVIELADWREVHGVALPFAAAFLHAGERFDYRYTAVLPFRLAPGSTLPAEPAALFARLGDLGALAAAHERVMAAHRASDAELLAAGGAPRSTVSGRGRLTESTREELIARMRTYLGAIRFTRYEDTVVPVVAVSADGTLGWLACEMEAEGTRTVEGGSEPLAYAFSWVELFARTAEAAAAGGAWTTIGNASSERP